MAGSEPEIYGEITPAPEEGRMTTYREAKIRGVLEDRYFFDDYDRVREIERICGDFSIRYFAEKQVQDLRGGWIDERTAARRIDNEQEYYDRRREEE